MCCLAKMGFSTLWQPTQSPGTSPLRSLVAFAEPCGSWQATQPPSTGRCFVFALAAASTMFLWQLAQSCFSSLSRLNLLADAWGSWQLAHLFSATGLCALFVVAGTMDGWHFMQTSPPCAERNLP